MSKESHKVLISAEQIRTRIAEMGKQISRDFAKEDILCVGILRGASLFMADLVREISVPVELEFIRCASYGRGMESSGTVEIEFAKVPADFEGRNVLLLDDVLDSGNTLKQVKDQFLKKKPKSIRTCVLLDKPARRQAAFDVDYRGFQIENHFVVGYGMDYQERYRNLPYIGVLQQD